MARGRRKRSRSHRARRLRGDIAPSWVVRPRALALTGTCSVALALTRPLYGWYSCIIHSCVLDAVSRVRFNVTRLTFQDRKEVKAKRKFSFGGELIVTVETLKLASSKAGPRTIVHVQHNDVEMR